MRRIGGTLGLFGLALIFLSILGEGLASLAFTIRAALDKWQPPVAERFYSQPDPMLGWINTPNAFRPGFFGPGKNVSINGQSFRSDHSIDDKVPAGKTRILCSGASYAFGNGVDGEETWCRYLEKKFSGVESVNLGQGGYGLDQSYLLYKTKADRLEHQIHIFSVTQSELSRVRLSRFLGYDKPRFQLREGRAVLENVPIARSSYRFPWLTQNLALFRELRSVQLFSQPGEKNELNRESFDRTTEITARLLQDLKERNEAKGSRFLLVLLPTKNRLDFLPRLRNRFPEMARDLGLEYLDLWNDFDAAPEEIRKGFFIEDPKNYYGKGHYTELGNRTVATWLGGHLPLGARADNLARLNPR